MKILFVNSFQNLLHIKLWHFRNKSLFRYFISTCLIFFGLKTSGDIKTNYWQYFLVIFLVTIAFSLIFIIISSFISSKKKHISELEFGDKGITIVDVLRKKSKFIKWTEIEGVKETKRDIFLVIKRKRSFYYGIDKLKLNNKELLYLTSLINNRIKNPK